MATRIELAIGLEAWSITVPEDRLLVLSRPPIPPLPAASPRELVREALEHPFGFEPLRRALTPDDRVTLVLDDRLPHAGELVAGVLEHLRTAGIGPDCVTVLTPPYPRAASDVGDLPIRMEERWIAELPDEFVDVKTEVHNPSDRGRVAYLATTKAGRRLYLNRTLVEADYLIVLSARGYDPHRGYGGAEAAIFPTFGDEELRQAYADQYSLNAPGADPWAVREEAVETTLLLGLPFFIQVIEGAGDSIQAVVAGLPNSTAEGIRRLDARWRGMVSQKADTVIATVSGDPRLLDFAALARAAMCAARVVVPEGRIALLTAAAPELPESIAAMCGMGDPATAAKIIAKTKPADGATARFWCFAAKTASLFLASQYPDEFAEELFATALHGPAELQRLIDSGGDVLVIPDAHKSMVTVAKNASSKPR